MKVLPVLMAKLSGKPRYRPEIIWSKKSWVHNVFRLYELIFWRRVGIRAESSTSLGVDEHGRKTVKHEFYTYEALFAHIEILIRRALSREWISVEITSWQFALPAQPGSIRIPHLTFAIALDASATGSASVTSPITWSHTVTGSNPLIAIGGGAGGVSTQANFTAASYNSVAATKADSQQLTTAGNVDEVSLWFLGSPSTGANTVSMTATLGSSPGLGGNSTSYTGAQSGSTKDASGKTTATTSGDKTFTVTTVADNCWIHAVGIARAASGPTLAADQTSRGSLAITMSGTPALLRAEDTNAAQTPPGAKTLGMTAGGITVSAVLIVGASFVPAGAAVTTHNLTLLGVGK